MTRLPILHTAPGFNEFGTYMTHLTCHEARLRPTPTLFRESIIHPATVSVAGPPVTDSSERDKQLPPPAYIDSDLHFDHDSTASDSLTSMRGLTDTDKHTGMLRWQYRLGHTPFRQLKEMAKQGLLDKRLANIQEFPFAHGANLASKPEEPGDTDPTRNFAADASAKLANLAMLSPSTP